MTLSTAGEALILRVAEFYFQEEYLVESELDLRVSSSSNLVDGEMTHEFLGPHVFLFPEDRLDDSDDFNRLVHGCPC